jgi:hypothetical protein
MTIAIVRKLGAFNQWLTVERTAWRNAFDVAFHGKNSTDFDFKTSIATLSKGLVDGLSLAAVLLGIAHYTNDPSWWGNPSWWRLSWGDVVTIIVTIMIIKAFHEARMKAVGNRLTRLEALLGEIDGDVSQRHRLRD